MQEEHDQSQQYNRPGDLAVLAILAGLAGVYLWDAVRASTAFLHLILVVPLSALILFLCALIGIRVLLRSPQGGREEALSGDSTGAGLVITLFAAYVATLGWLGFDVGTALFIGIFLWLHGERRWAWVVAYSVAYGFGLALAFSSLLPYAMPLLLLTPLSG